MEAGATIVCVAPPLILYVKVKGATPLLAVKIMLGAASFWHNEVPPVIVAVDVACTSMIILPVLVLLHKVLEASTTDTRL